MGTAGSSDTKPHDVREVSFHFDPSGTPDSEIRQPAAYQIGYIPSAFTLADSAERERKRRYVYLNDEGCHLVIEISVAEDVGLLVDTEYNDYYKIMIGDNQAYLLYNDQDQIGTLVWMNGGNVITVDGIVSKEELIKVAENIK